MESEGTKCAQLCAGARCPKGLLCQPKLLCGIAGQQALTQDLVVDRHLVALHSKGEETTQRATHYRLWRWYNTQHEPIHTSSTCTPSFQV
jgi:hypothetical protein